VELAPWMGGFYERLVGVVKRAFRKTTGRKRLELVQLQTIIKEVEAIVNSRPLVYVGDDVNSNITLTPNHFLVLNPAMGIPEVDYDENDDDYTPQDSSSDKLLKIWKKGQTLLNGFWRMWREDYLASLRERTQSTLKCGRIQSTDTATIGDVVLVKDDIPRGCWRMGKIEQLVVSRDGQVRSAKVKLASGKTLGRPLQLLYPIECSTRNSPENIDETDEEDVRTATTRPRRRASELARQRINEQLNG